MMLGFVARALMLLLKYPFLFLPVILLEKPLVFQAIKSILSIVMAKLSMFKRDNYTPIKD